MTIENTISQGVSQALKELYGAEVAPETIVPQATRKEFEGNFTVVVFPFLKASKKKPEETAKQIGEWLQNHYNWLGKFNVVKGFLNLTINPKYWVKVLNEISETEDFGFKKSGSDSKLIMVEYSSPNTNKPLHLGHVRNNLLGYSLSRILEANGNKVVKTNIVNDRGIHICKSMLAWQKWGYGETPESSGKKGDHLIGDYYVEFDKHYKEELKKLPYNACQIPHNNHR